MKRLEIEWIDPCSFGIDWMEKGEIFNYEATHCKTIGYLLHEDESQIKLCMNLTPDKFAQAMIIPRGVIVEIRELRAK